MVRWLILGSAPGIAIRRHSWIIGKFTSLIIHCTTEHLATCSKRCIKRKYAAVPPRRHRQLKWSKMGTLPIFLVSSLRPVHATLSTSALDTLKNEINFLNHRHTHIESVTYRAGSFLIKTSNWPPWCIGSVQRYQRSSRTADHVICMIISTDYALTVKIRFRTLGLAEFVCF